MTAQEYCKKTSDRHNDLIWCFADRERLDPIQEQAESVSEFLKLVRANVKSVRCINGIDFVELDINKIKTTKI